MAFGAWQATITDPAGNVIPNAAIDVRREVAGLPPAACFADRDGTVPLGSLFNAGPDGFIRFHAPGGPYQIKASSGSFSRTWRYVPIGTMAEQDAVGGFASRTRLTSDTIFTIGAGQQFATMQAAWGHVCNNLDGAGFNVDLQLANGTHAGGLDDHSPGVDSISAKAGGVSPVGVSRVRLIGNVGSPGSVVIDLSSGGAGLGGIRVAHSHLEVSGMRFHNPTVADGSALVCAWSGRLIIGAGIQFGDAGEHIHASSGGHVAVDANYTINGDAGRHWFAHSHGQIRVGHTITLTGTPGFADAFAIAGDLGLIEVFDTAFVGGATGPRFSIAGLGRLTGAGGNLNFLPGNQAGELGAGGMYDDFMGEIEIVP